MDWLDLFGVQGTLRVFFNTTDNNLSLPRGPTLGAAAERSYFTFKVRRGGHEEIPFIQCKEQRLHFAGAAVKRYSTYKARETQVRM